MKNAALQTTATSALDEFRARCEAHARDVREGKLGFIDAVDALQNTAVAYGIVDEKGQDAVQLIMAQAFCEVSP
jgi:hypothetical protein